MSSNKIVLVTGAAGFIGFHLCEKLLELNYNVIGLDNINDYYSVDLKFSRLTELGILKTNAEKYNSLFSSFKYGDAMRFIRINLEDQESLFYFFSNNKIDIVCNLAAQAGVRYSIKNPRAYIESNINGFLNILECCRNFKVKRLVYASSSSVYGNNDKVPFEESDNVDFPVSLYAATKKSNELMAHTYNHLYGIQTIGLRFFTVYGPWGRPDMAPMLFANSIFNAMPIKVFNSGNLSRDFTYIDDIVDGIVSTLAESRENECEIYNIGNGKPVNLLEFIKTLENIIGKSAEKIMIGMQPGDVYTTWANTNKIKKYYGYEAKTSIEKGVSEFINWYKKYHFNNK